MLIPKMQKTQQNFFGILGNYIWIGNGKFCLLVRVYS